MRGVCRVDDIRPVRTATRHRVGPWRMAAYLVASLAFCPLMLPSVVAAPTQPDGPVPGPNDRQITLAVKSYLEREHFLRRPIDDEVAGRWFDTFIEALDPMK
ncbi:MAG: hypothetical protein EBZ13_04010, partial [Planctomycetia bacterium]|nr:hypothetical protein [Planctomycetia bacterium]